MHIFKCKAEVEQWNACKERVLKELEDSEGQSNAVSSKQQQKAQV